MDICLLLPSSRQRSSGCFARGFVVQGLGFRLQGLTLPTPPTKVKRALAGRVQENPERKFSNLAGSPNAEL